MSYKLYDGLIKFILLTTVLCSSTVVQRKPNFAFHGKDGYANAPVYYVIRTLPILFTSWSYIL
jgi:hypothetical protein